MLAHRNSKQISRHLDLCPRRAAPCHQSEPPANILNRAQRQLHYHRDAVDEDGDHHDDDNEDGDHDDDDGRLTGQRIMAAQSARSAGISGVEGWGKGRGYAASQGPGLNRRRGREGGRN
eukprot:GHVT01026707.1.p1 GENE.GHVT01026707.1~~GHVT01026707.1.p1  ORF type:complete len:119 (-),score=5.16 GHVT01026707.1:165-521(-)